jgi:hypothetical protein
VSGVRRLGAALIEAVEGLSPLEAARTVARPEAATMPVVPSDAAARARLVIDLYEWKRAQRTGRKASGLFYTPRPVIDAVLDRADLRGTILDPAAGAGAFLLALCERAGAKAGKKVLPRLHACDVDGEALEACALAFEVLLGERHLGAIEAWQRSNTHVGDALRDALPFGAMSLVVGNPPYGISTAPDLTTRFPELQGERDLFACFLLRARSWLAPGGTAALLIPDTWLTNRHAAGLRQTLARGASPRLVIDFGKPFPTARDMRVHAVFVGPEPRARCEVLSERDGLLLPMATVSRAALTRTAERGWHLYRTEAEARAMSRLEAGSEPLSRRFDVLYGLRTGDNGRHLRTGAGEVPVVGGGDLEPFDRRPSRRHLIVTERFSRAVARQLGRPKIALQRIRSNAKASWRRWLEAALCARDEVGLDSLTLVAACEATEDELLGLLGVLNSSLLNRWYKLTYTDVNVKPAYVTDLPVPKRFPSELVACVRERLRVGPDAALERAVDRLVADAYGLDGSTLAVLEEGFWGDELSRRPMPSLVEARAGRAIAAAS